MSEVTSQEIKKALAAKHYAEFFMTEVKNGSSAWSWSQIDAMAIYKSWSHQRIVAYEVKVSRSDFLRDAKMNSYLKYCHELYLICPHGMIAATELPIEIGLMWYNPKTGKIVTKRKALFRHIPMDADLLYYIIMYRLQSDRYRFHSSKAEYFREWLAGRENNRKLGREISGKLPQEICRLQDEIKNYSNVKYYQELVDGINKVLQKHGITCWGKDEIIRRLDESLSKRYTADLDITLRQLDAVTRAVKEIHDKNKAQEVHS